MNERRRSRRRRMPFVRSGILEVGARSHIVAVTDLSAEGAFLSTRVEPEPRQAVVLRLVVPRDGRVVALPCRVVRHNPRFDAASGLPAGLAVRFKGLDADTARRIGEFAAEGFLPAPHPPPQEHFEYRVLDRPAVEAGELERLGLDGWQLAAALPSRNGVQLVLMRRL